MRSVIPWVVASDFCFEAGQVRTTRLRGDRDRPIVPGRRRGSPFRKSAPLHKYHASAPVVPVPQNASTVHRGQLPTPDAGGATERSGHCPARTDWKPGLRCLRHQHPQIAEIGVPGRFHAAGHAAVPAVAGCRSGSESGAAGQPSLTQR